MPAAGAAALAQQPQRCNVLMIAVDDLNNRIGCYGDPIVKTPNIDRLARTGIRFDRAYCNYPLCNPTRASLLSGFRPETTRVFNNDTPPRAHVGNAKFLPEYFKANGYFTARVGKIAHGAFEHQIEWDISENARRPAGAGGGQKKRRDEPGPNRLEWRATDGSDADEPDGRTARRIVEIIEQNKQKPFFIGCGFHKPHLPWVAPKKYFDLYDPEKMPLPKTPANDRDDIPPLALTYTAADAKMTDYERRQAIAAYHAATTFMDAQLGLVLDALDRNKLWENTVVLLFGDHGWHLYDHLQLWRKMTVFEQSARAPLVVYAPGMERGTSCARLVEFVDIYPSLVELAGLPAKPDVQGNSFAALLRNPRQPWKNAAYTMVTRGADRFGRSVRTERYRYSEWQDGKAGVELYDHETDPNEWTNLAGRVAHAKVEAEMKALLHARRS
jgi:uncharacterized sulfatase